MGDDVIPAVAGALITQRSGCSTSPQEQTALILTPSPSSPVIVDQQSQAPIVPRGFPEEGVNQNDELQARRGDMGQES